MQKWPLGFPGGGRRRASAGVCKGHLVNEAGIKNLGNNVGILAQLFLSIDLHQFIIHDDFVFVVPLQHARWVAYLGYVLDELIYINQYRRITAMKVRLFRLLAEKKRV